MNRAFRLCVAGLIALATMFVLPATAWAGPLLAPTPTPSGPSPSPTGADLGHPPNPATAIAWSLLVAALVAVAFVQKWRQGRQ